MALAVIVPDTSLGIIRLAMEVLHCHALDPHVHPFDLARQFVDQIQVLPEHEAVVVADQPGDDLGQFHALAAQTTPRQLGQDLRIVLPRNHGLQDRPAGHTHDVRHLAVTDS